MTRSAATGALRQQALQALLQEIPSTGGTLLLFDTCSAGTYNSTAPRSGGVGAALRAARWSPDAGRGG
jgi:hypothetical protein